VHCGIFFSFHFITDYAIIISGDKLLIMDPIKSEQKLGEECLIVNLKEIKDEPLIKETLTCVIGKFGFDSTALQTDFYDGTLFWFPLRQSASALNQTVYTSKKVEHLFSSFTQEASYIPLFLRSLEKIEIYDWDDTEPMLTVQMYGSDSENFKQERNTFRYALRELDRSNKLPVDNIYSKLEFVIKTTRRIDKGNQELPAVTQNEWTVVSCFIGTNEMSRDVQLLTRDPDIPGTLYTGVAFCTNSGLDQRASGQIFCFLPIPFTDESLTGLPVHVNAFFSLEDNRRHLKFGTTGDRTDNSALWNDTIIKDFLPEVYLILTKTLREKSEKNRNTPNLVRDFHDSIPDPDNVKEDWRPLLSNLYERLLLEPIFYTANNGGLWVRLPDALINMFNEERDTFSHTLEIFLLDCGKNFVTIPSHMKRVLENRMSDRNEISPKTVRDNLKNSTCWKRYTNSQKVDLLSFILQDGNWGDLGGIELLPLDNGTFTTFPTAVQAEDIYVLNEEYADLFPGLGSKLVSLAYISKIIWRDLSSMAEKGTCI
jgi:sacsin